MKLRLSACVILACCCGMSLCAEQVTLKNGDRLTGTVLNVSDKKLTIKTEHAGTITIDWDAVAQFSSEQPMVVTRNNKQVVSGPVSTKDSDVAVATTSGTQTFPVTDIAVMRSTSDQAAYEKSLHPGMLEGWAGGGNFGLALARGNSDTTNLDLGFKAARPTTTDKWSIQAASLYATSTANNVTTTSANALGGSIRYDRNLNKKLFAFGLFAGAYDHSQDLDERFSPSGGLGYHVIATNLTTLDLLGGNLNFGDRYNSIPIAGKKNNDILLTTGLGLTFGNKAK